MPTLSVTFLPGRGVQSLVCGDLPCVGMEWLTVSSTTLRRHSLEQCLGGSYHGPFRKYPSTKRPPWDDTLTSFPHGPLRRPVPVKTDGTWRPRSTTSLYRDPFDTNILDLWPLRRTLRPRSFRWSRRPHLRPLLRVWRLRTTFLVSLVQKEEGGCYREVVGDDCLKLYHDRLFTFINLPGLGKNES